VHRWPGCSSWAPRWWPTTVGLTAPAGRCSPTRKATSSASSAAPRSGRQVGPRPADRRRRAQLWLPKGIRVKLLGGCEKHRAFDQKEHRTPPPSVMVLSCGNSVQPAAEADECAGGPVDVPDAVQQPAPAAQRPGVGQMGDRLLHQRAQPRLQTVERVLGVAEAVLGPAVPEGTYQCSRALASPRNPRSSRLATSTPSSTPSSPDSSKSSCSWQLPGQPPSSHQRSPWMVDTASPWAVWVCRLQSYRTFWLAHPQGRCTRVASPSTTTASPAWAISTSSSRRSARVVTNVPSGWQYPSAASGPSSRSRLSLTSVLEMPTMRPGAGTTARPAARRRPRPGGPPATVAGCRLVQAGVVAAGGRGARPARPARVRAATSAGSMPTGTRPPGRRENLAYGLVPVNVRPHRAPRTPSIRLPPMFALTDRGRRSHVDAGLQASPGGA
jgi:hypothetical protein